MGISQSIKTILSVPIISHLTKNTHVDVLILGAWGCGVFHNDSTFIATQMADAIMMYGGHYQHIFFAIPTSNANSIVFQQVFALKHLQFNIIN